MTIGEVLDLASQVEGQCEICNAEAWSSLRTLWRLRKTCTVYQIIWLMPWHLFLFLCFLGVPLGWICDRFPEFSEFGEICMAPYGRLFNRFSASDFDRWASRPWRRKRCALLLLTIQAREQN